MTYDHQKSFNTRVHHTLPQPLLPGGLYKGRRVAEKLGHDPESALRAMRDFGLCDREIARYYGMTPSTIRRLERYFGSHPKS